MKHTNNSALSVPAKRSPGHRAVDARDAIAELTERAQEISQEAGSRVAIAMKDVISAAAGIAGFAVESARDLVQFMVRRGQMTPEEGDKLLRDAETAHSRRPASERKKPTASEIHAKERAVRRAKAAAARDAAMAHQHAVRAAHTARKAAPKKAATRKAAPRKAATRKAAPRKAATRKAALRKSATRKSSRKKPVKAKPKAKPARHAKKGAKRR